MEPPPKVAPILETPSVRRADARLTDGTVRKPRHYRAKRRSDAAP
jgi:hypothetical protein